MTTILKLARKATGLDQVELGDALDTNNATISRVERGINTTRREIVRSLYEFYGQVIPLQWVYDPNHPDAPGELSQAQSEKLGRIGRNYREKVEQTA